MIKLPIKGWPADVLDPLVDMISEVVEEDQIDEFYIGRTNDLVATRSRHRADEVHSLYQTDSADNAIDVEDKLIKTFKDHPKCSNDSEHGGGGASDDFVNYVYLAVWYK